MINHVVSCYIMLNHDKSCFIMIPLLNPLNHHGIYTGRSKFFLIFHIMVKGRRKKTI